MKCVRNATDFERELQEIRKFYEEKCLKRITETYAIFVNNEPGKLPESTKVALEAHTRTFYIDALLRALNWQFESKELLNLIPEFPIKSLSAGTTRFIDYFGLDATNNALLILETKRPSSTLPRLKQNKSQFSIPDKDNESLLINLFLSGNVELTEDWGKWLETLRDYSKSVSANNRAGQYPRRVVITNGDWLIIFLDPKDSFSNTSPKLNRIIVYKNWNDVEKNTNQIFEYLEYYQVLGRTPPLSFGEIGFHLHPNNLDVAMFGLRLIYEEEIGFSSENTISYDSTPRLKVLPVVFIRTTNGVWFRIDSRILQESQYIPHDQILIKAHIDKINESAIDLLEKINKKLGANLTCRSLAEHYASKDLFDELVTVTRKNIDKGEEFVIVTGSNTHYLKVESTIPNCDYHRWDNSKREGCATGNYPVKNSKIRDPRTIFKTDVEHHCSHQDIMKSKSSKLTIQNRDRCGSRSGKDQEAFCEIWKFEEHLCCRTCAFEEVCTKADVFQGLPCKNGSA